MNPEQWPGYEKNGDPAGQLPDAGSDLFALGVTLYQLLSHGRLPYGEVVQYQLGRYHRRYEAPVLGGAFDEGFPHDGVR